jgi:hypothetical protein
MFFLSSNSAKNRWKPLINALKHIKVKNKPPIENDIEENELESLIRNDLITCV